jgi:hypothetical protein
MGGILKDFEAFDYKFKTFIEVTRLFEDIFRDIEAFSKITRLFQR